MQEKYSKTPLNKSSQADYSDRNGDEWSFICTTFTQIDSTPPARQERISFPQRKICSPRFANGASFFYH
jgi:hypothetical protein